MIIIIISTKLEEDVQKLSFKGIVIEIRVIINKSGLDAVPPFL
jgi:hypothetical protein